MTSAGEECFASGHTRAMCDLAIPEALAYLTEHGADVVYVPDFLAAAEADAYLSRLQREVTLDSPEESRIRRPFSTEWVPIPRQQSAYGDPGTRYVFSGTSVEARAWIPVLEELRARVEPLALRSPNFVLINRYRNGSDCMGWHADDERDLGAEPEILSLTLGSARSFQFRHKASFPRSGQPARRPDLRTVSLPLEHGSLLVMRHPTNRDWKHQLPRRGGRQPDRIGERWNLTWRRVEAGAS